MNENRLILKHCKIVQNNFYQGKYSCLSAIWLKANCKVLKGYTEKSRKSWFHKEGTICHSSICKVNENWPRSKRCKIVENYFSPRTIFVHIFNTVQLSRCFGRTRICALRVVARRGLSLLASDSRVTRKLRAILRDHLANAQNHLSNTRDVNQICAIFTI